MRNASKISWQLLFNACLLLAFLVPVQIGQASEPVTSLLCPGPNVSITARSSGSVSFAWDAVSGALSYKVWYHRQEDSYTSGEFTTGGTSISFSDLPTGTYTFYFASVCTGGLSDIIIIDILI